MTGKRLPRLRPTVWDGAVAACVVLLACAVLLGHWRGGAVGRLTAVIYSDGVETERVELPQTDTSEERTYSANGYTLRVAFYTDGVQVLMSDCPTQDCVHTGTVRHSGQSIVCLPARMVIRLEGGTASDEVPDAVLR